MDADVVLAAARPPKPPDAPDASLQVAKSFILEATASYWAKKYQSKTVVKLNESIAQVVACDILIKTETLFSSPQYDVKLDILRNLPALKRKL